MSQSPRAVFLSYASEDAEAAQRLAESLRAAGVEVWLDQSELRGGDAWDQHIRHEIHDCTLFIPIISAHTQSRPEGYFRLEWKLAVDRSHLMAAEKAFLLPVVIDATTHSKALVPDRFREVQWTHLPSGGAADEFVKRVVRLLDEPVAQRRGASAPAAPATTAPASQRVRRWAIALTVSVLAIFLALEGLPWLKRLGKNGAAIAESRVIAQKSIAVLPFADLSEKRDQEYFSDGLAEELLDLLAKIKDLQVIARTSSFYFKGKQVTVPEIARTLGVAHILEGSVRKSGNIVRVTTELIRARDGVHIWSETYDRALDDVFRVQDDIATSVVKALKVQLLPSERAAVLPRAVNSEAYYQYLLGRGLQGRDDWPLALQAYRKAIALDPQFAPAYARLAIAENFVADRANDTAGFQRAVEAAERAVELGPDVADGYSARAFMRYTYLWDWKGAAADLERASALDPGDATVQRRYGDLLDTLGRLPEAIAATRRAIEMDPLSAPAWQSLGLYLYSVGELPAARQALNRSFEINPDGMYIHWHLGVLELLSSEPQKALTHFRQIKTQDLRLAGIAIAEHALHHATESQAALNELIATLPHEAADQIAEAFAWRGDRDKAFEWLERAYAQRDGGISDVKTDPLLAGLRSDPRYPAFLRKLGLPP